MTEITAAFRLTAPLHHGAFGHDTGNVSLLRRVPLWCGDRAVPVPCVSGNALRGVMRRLVMRDLLHRGGLDHQTPGWDHLYAALCNGGHRVGSEKRPDPAATRALRAACPPLSLFGAALYSEILEGRMEVGFAWLLCLESVEAGVLPDQPAPFSDELVSEVALVRHIETEHQDPEVTGVTAMPTEVETLIPGAQLQSSILVRGTELEQSIVAWCLDRITTLGGKGARGLGRVQVTHDAPVPGQVWEDWLTDHHEEAGEWLRSFAEDLAPKPKKSGRKKK